MSAYALSCASLLSGEKPLKKDLLSQDGLTLLAAWRRNGLRLEDIANNLGVSLPTLTRWIKEETKIREALNKGKEVVDFQVENALLNAALGGKKITVKTIISDKDGTRTERTEEDIPPNVTACLAWLNNRKPQDWRRNRDNETNEERNNSPITIKIVRGDDKIQISQGVEDADEWGDIPEDDEDGGEW